MPRYKLLIEYDGAPFVGWQVQENDASVQGALMTAIAAFSGEAAALLGQQQYGWFAALIAAHVAGSILMTIAGILSVRLAFGF